MKLKNTKKSSFASKVIWWPFNLIAYLFLINFIASLFTWHEHNTHIVAEQSNLTEEIDTHFKSMAKLFSWDGAITISQGGKISHLSYGESNWTHKTESLVASVSKTFIGQALYQLEQTGRLSLDDSICKHLTQQCESDDIKLHNLLSHTSGLENSYNILKRIFIDVKSTFTSQPLDVSVTDHSPLFGEPNKKFKYYNFNFLLSSKIIENITGKNLNEALQDLIFKPAQMTNTYVFSKKGPRFPVKPGCPIVQPLYWSQKCPQRILPFESFQGAGGVVSTTEDLIKYANYTKDLGFLEQVKNSPNKGAISKQNSYALGWVENSNGYFMHNGKTLGYRSELIIWPEKNLMIALLSNSNASSDIEFYVNELYTLITGKEYHSPSKKNWFPKLK